MRLSASQTIQGRWLLLLPRTCASATTILSSSWFIPRGSSTYKVVKQKNIYDGEPIVQTCHHRRYHHRWTPNILANSSIVNGISAASPRDWISPKNLPEFNYCPLRNSPVFYDFDCSSRFAERSYVITINSFMSVTHNSFMYFLSVPQTQNYLLCTNIEQCSCTISDSMSGAQASLTLS